MKTKVKVVSIVTVVDPSFDPPVRNNVRLESPSGIRMIIEGVSDEDLPAFCVCKDDGTPLRDRYGRVSPGDAEFTLTKPAPAPPPASTETDISPTPASAAVIDNAA